MENFKVESDTYFNPHGAHPLFCSQFLCVPLSFFVHFLGHSIGKLTLAKKLSKNKHHLFEKGKRTNDETAEDSRGSNTKKSLCINYKFIAISDSHSLNWLCINNDDQPFNKARNLQSCFTT